MLPFPMLAMSTGTAMPATTMLLMRSVCVRSFREGFISSLALATTLSLFKRGDYEPVSNEQNRLSDVS